jgi:hypothetical protein
MPGPIKTSRSSSLTDLSGEAFCVVSKAFSKRQKCNVCRSSSYPHSLSVCHVDAFLWFHALQSCNNGSAVSIDTVQAPISGVNVEKSPEREIEIPSGSRRELHPVVKWAARRDSYLSA